MGRKDVQTHWHRGGTDHLGTGTSECLLEGLRYLIRSGFCCLHHVSKHIGCFHQLWQQKRNASMSIALLVFIQSPCELFPAKSMALQCFQTWPHRSFFIAIEQMVSKASKNTQRSTLFLLPIGEQCAALLKYKQFLWASERVLVPFCQSQQAELPGETARAFSLCAWTHEMQGKSPGPQTSHSGWKQLNQFYSREKKNLYLWSDFPIFGGKVSLSHYPQACCGIQFQWCLPGEAWGLEESKAAAVWVGLEPCPWYGGLFMLSSRCPLQQGLSCT